MSVAVMAEEFAVLADLFRYPDGSYFDRLLRAKGLLDDPDADAFVREASALDRSQLEVTYTATFDLAPSCSPYAGVCLFGEDGGKRGRLLSGLRSTYEKAGIEENGELPDHVGELLRFAAHEEADEWLDVMRLILVPALSAMDAQLRSSSNPYRHLIIAARRVSEAALARGGR